MIALSAKADSFSDQMKLQGEDSSSVLGVALMHSLSIYTPATKSTTKGSGLPLPAKAGSPRPVN